MFVGNIHRVEYVAAMILGPVLSIAIGVWTAVGLMLVALITVELARTLRDYERDH